MGSDGRNEKGINYLQAEPLTNQGWQYWSDAAATMSYGIPDYRDIIIKLIGGINKLSVIEKNNKNGWVISVDHDDCKLFAIANTTELSNNDWRDLLALLIRSGIKSIVDCKTTTSSEKTK